jgi:hypothetical protein
MTDGKFNPTKYKKKQSGGGMGGMYSNKPFMIPVNPHVTRDSEKKMVVGNQITPMAAVEERAKSDLKEEIKENVPHVPVGSIKVNSRSQPIRSNQNVKKNTSTKKKSARGTNKAKNKGRKNGKSRTPKSKKKQISKRKADDDLDGYSIFSKKLRQ